MSFDTNQEYAEAVKEYDDKGRTVPMYMTDREIHEETLILLRNLGDMIEGTLKEIGPAMSMFQSGPFGKLLGR